MDQPNLNQIVTLLIFDHVVSVVFVYVTIGLLLGRKHLFPRFPPLRPLSQQEEDQ